MEPVLSAGVQGTVMRVCLSLRERERERKWSYFLVDGVTTGQKKKKRELLECVVGDHVALKEELMAPVCGASREDASCLCCTLCHTCTTFKQPSTLASNPLVTTHKAMMSHTLIRYPSKHRLSRQT